MGTRNRRNRSSKAPKTSEPERIDSSPDEAGFVGPFSSGGEDSEAETSESHAVSEEKPHAPSHAPPAPKNRCVLGLYSRAYALRKLLKAVDPKLTRVNDRLLASIGYPSKLIAYLFAVPELANLSALISDFRTFNRVVQTPQTVEWALDLLLENNNPDKLDRYGDYIQAVSGVAYQLLEDWAYLASKGVLRTKPSRQTDLWVVSCMFWAVHVLIELLRVPYYRYVLHKPVSIRNLVVNLAWAPLTVHWSTYNGIFSEGWVGLFGTLACWPNLVYQWRQ